MSLESKRMGEDLNIGRRMSEIEFGIDEKESADLKLLVFRAH